jgi:hypothetical protein
VVAATYRQLLAKAVHRTREEEHQREMGRKGNSKKEEEI